MADKRISQLVDRGTVANNDVVPIVVSGATTTNKATISSIQTFMQENLDVGVTSVGITLGSSGTDVSVTGSPITTSGNITINIPDASATARGLVTTGTQTFAGAKTFNNSIIAGTDVQLVAAGSANPTILRNTSGTSSSTTGSNVIGFNNVNNIFVSTQTSGGFILGFNNSVSNREYTLPNASGTIALTSNLDAYVTLGTTQTITATKTFTTSGSANTINVNHTSGSGIALDISKAGNGEGLRVAKSSGSGNAVTITGGLLSAQEADFSGLLTGVNARFTQGVALQSDGGTNQLTTFINTSAVHSGSSGSNRFGFNGNNNIYFSKGLSNGGIIAWNNAAARTYTLPDADGTIALTSNLSAYLPLTGGTLTGALNGTSASFTGDVNLATTSGNVGVFTTSPDIFGRFDEKNLGVSVASASQNLALQLNAGASAGRGAQIYMGQGGTRHFTISSNVSESRAGTTTNTPFILTTNDTTRLTIASTGAATFSSSVTATRLSLNNSGTSARLQINGVNSEPIAYLYNNSGTAGSVPGVAIEAGTNSSDYALSVASSLGSPYLRVRGDGNVGIGTTSPTTYSLAGRHLEVNDAGGGFSFIHNNTTSVKSFLASNESGGVAALFTFSNHPLTFGTNNTERMRITDLGELLWNVTGLAGANLNTGGVLFRNNSGKYVQLSTGLTTDSSLILFYKSDGAGSVTNTGSISTSGSSTSYNTTSDYRLKENVNPVQNALSILTELKPCTFNYITDSEKEVMGFIAHEVQQVIPQAVTGEKDGFKIEEVEVSPAEIDEEGNIITEAVIEEKEIPVYQGIDHSKLVPLLVAAIQEQQKQIDSLKNQMQ